jgi:hypothetical protein
MTDYESTIPTNFSVSDALASFVRVEVIEGARSASYDVQLHI